MRGCVGLDFGLLTIFVRLLLAFTFWDFRYAHTEEQLYDIFDTNKEEQQRESNKHKESSTETTTSSTPPFRHRQQLQRVQQQCLLHHCRPS